MVAKLPTDNVLMRAVWGWREPWLCVWRAGINRLGYAPDESAFYNIQSEISARDLILLLGGLFLIWKAARKSTNPLKVKKKG